MASLVLGMTLSFAADAPALAKGGSGSLLSGYGAPGGGEQVLLGSTLVRGGGKAATPRPARSPQAIAAVPAVPLGGPKAAGAGGAKAGGRGGAKAGRAAAGGAATGGRVGAKGGRGVQAGAPGGGRSAAGGGARGTPSNGPALGVSTPEIQPVADASGSSGGAGRPLTGGELGGAGGVLAGLLGLGLVTDRLVTRPRLRH
jgi:hypothetical protein